MAISAKITKKGQVTIPKEIRKLLNSDVVEFAVDEEKIIIKPVSRAAGALSGYANKYVPLKDIKDAVLETALRDKGIQ